jgi:predicted RNA-binding protein with PIN domain
VPVVRLGSGGGALRPRRLVTDPLRPAVELALEIARAGEELRPPVPVPARLRPFVRFDRLPGPAIEAVRRVVDGEEALRARTAEVARQAGIDVGRAGELWLDRPEGWEVALEELLAEARDADGEVREQRAVAELERRLDRERAARDRVERRARAEAEARGALESRLRAVEDELASLRTQAAELEAAAQAAAAERAEAVRSLKEAERRAQAAAAERNESRRELRALRAQRGVGAGDRDAGPEPDRPVAEAAAIAASVAEATVRLQELQAGLEEVRARLGGALEPPLTRTGEAPAATGEPRPQGPASARRPVRLPGGVRDDGLEAAEHLVRVPGSVVLVDGYNVSKTAWSDLAPPEQRDRLVQALGELSARTGTHVEVVFDGAEQTEPTRPVRPPHGVRLRFSPPDVEADDVLLELLDAQPRGRAVVVVSSDGRVRAGASARGANVLHARQLLDALRR